MPVKRYFRENASSARNHPRHESAMVCSSCRLFTVPAMCDASLTNTRTTSVRSSGHILPKCCWKTYWSILQHFSSMGNTSAFILWILNLVEFVFCVARQPHELQVSEGVMPYPNTSHAATSAQSGAGKIASSKSYACANQLLHCT